MLDAAIWQELGGEKAHDARRFTLRLEGFFRGDCSPSHASKGTEGSNLNSLTLAMEETAEKTSTSRIAKSRLQEILQW
jgi:hypothetical protein